MPTQSIKVQNGAEPPYIFKYLRWLWALSLELFSIFEKNCILSCLTQFKNKKRGVIKLAFELESFKDKTKRVLTGRTIAMLI